MKFLSFVLLCIGTPLSLMAQFSDPSFEQGGTGWVIQCPELTWVTPSAVPHGGSMAMAVQATSTDFPLCPSVDPEGGWTPAPNFYQTIPQAIPGDVVRFKFQARLEEGIPQPSGSIVVPYAITVDSEGALHYPITDVALGVDNPIASWEQFPGQVTVPTLPTGHVFAIGFGAHTFGGSNGIVHFDNMAMLIQGSGARLNAKAWLDGAYVPGANLMRDDLRAADLIPTSQPVSPIGAATTPAGGETIAPGVLSIAGPNAIVDWVWVELRFGRPENASTGWGWSFYETYALRHALVQRDGDIVDMDGTSPVLLPIKAGNCYVVVRHRNHLGVMSAQPLALNATPVVFDTRATSTPLFSMPTPYTDAARKTVGSTRTLWPGNAWTLGAPYGILYTGQGNDRDPILYAIGGSLATNVLGDYHRADINLDGVVKYTGINNDRDIILQTIGGSVATAVRYEQVP
ncbi:MAG TPA: hypothetical protein PLE78_14170 [Flavobacteriales bacterium]|nr:hypothetical protein [Flavobacteriales bacterium]